MNLHCKSLASFQHSFPIAWSDREHSRWRNWWNEDSGFWTCSILSSMGHASFVNYPFTHLERTRGEGRTHTANCPVRCHKSLVHRCEDVWHYQFAPVDFCHLGFLFYFFALSLWIFQNRKLKKKTKYVVLGHVRIMYIQNICIMKRPNGSHVIVDICTIVVVFCVYQDEFLYLIGEGSESTPNVLFFLKAWLPRWNCLVVFFL